MKKEMSLFVLALISFSLGLILNFSQVQSLSAQASVSQPGQYVPTTCFNGYDSWQCNNCASGEKNCVDHTCSDCKFW